MKQDLVKFDWEDGKTAYQRDIQGYHSDTEDQEIEGECEGLIG